MAEEIYFEMIWSQVWRVRVVICPVHVALLPPRHRQGDEGGSEGG